MLFMMCIGAASECDAIGRTSTSFQPCVMKRHGSRWALRCLDFSISSSHSTSVTDSFPDKSEDSIVTMAVQLQSDLSMLGIQGLGAFSTVLSALTADNVAPMAMHQLEKLGAAFHVSGPFAARVPDLLQRFSSTPIGRLGVTIGWRKGDSASLLASTAGGQAVALLSATLANLCLTHRSGEVLFELSSKILPIELRLASVKQLDEASMLLASKLVPVGFGNLLAKQVKKLHRIYQSLGSDTPTNLLDDLSTEAFVDLLVPLSLALLEEEKIVRISGSSALAHIVGLVLFMFPHDTMVSVEDIVIHEGPRRSILVEVRKDIPGPARITSENAVGMLGPVKHLITEEVHSYHPNGHEARYSFAWQGWLANKLHLILLDVNLTCTSSVIAAFCNFLVATLAVEFDLYEASERPNHSVHLRSFLGPYSQSIIDETCQEILLQVPTADCLTIEAALNNFLSAIDPSCGKISSLCTCGTCDLKTDSWIGINNIGNATRVCRMKYVWSKIGWALSAGVICFFVRAKPGVFIDCGFLRDASLGKYIVAGNLKTFSNLKVRPERIYEEIMGTQRDLIVSYGCSIYSMVLERLEVPSREPLQFELQDGRIIYEGRYYSVLWGEGTAVRPRATQSIVEPGNSILPSNFGEHSSLLITVREVISGLRLKVTARYGGLNIPLAIDSQIIAGLYVRLSRPCCHPPTAPLTDNLKTFVLTSVSSPAASGKSLIALTMTSSNPTAQFLCLEKGVKTLFMSDCCLPCAVEQARAQFCRMIIVS